MAVPVVLSIILQILVRSIATPPTGAGALILLPPSAPSLKYTSSDVASICAFSIAFIEAPLALAALMTLVTYVPTWAHVAVALRSWNGLNWRNQVAELHTPSVLAPPVMMPWPFLFCQKPIVNAPVFAGPHTSTVLLAVWPVWTIFATLVYMTQLLAGTFTVWA